MAVIGATEERFPFSEVAPFPRRRLRGLLVSCLGWAVYAGWGVAFIGIAAVVAETLNGSEAALFGGMVLWVALAFAVLPRALKLIVRGRRIRAVRGLELLARDRRAPVLLLRSFQDDDLLDPTSSVVATATPQRYEDRLARVLRRVGPVVAIGRPGEPEPELGAARIYVRNEDWQDAVVWLMQRAGAVVVEVGRSPGVWWEIESALTHVAPERLLFFFPRPIPREILASFWRYQFAFKSFLARWLAREGRLRMQAEREARYRQFCERIGPLLPAPLPPSLGQSSFLTFDPDGTPRLLLRAQPRLVMRFLMLSTDASADLHVRREIRPFVRNLLRR